MFDSRIALLLPHPVLRKKSLFSEKFTGTNVTVRAAKIVAGLEVNKTLELLHTIGKAIDEKVGIITLTFLLISKFNFNFFGIIFRLTPPKMLLSYQNKKMQNYKIP